MSSELSLLCAGSAPVRANVVGWTFICCGLEKADFDHYSARETGQEMHARLTRSIDERRIIGFFYEGRAAIVEPRLLGRDRAGDLILGGWQINGGEHRWQEYRLSQMSSLIERSGPFTGVDGIDLGSVVEVIRSGFVTKPA